MYSLVKCKTVESRHGRSRVSDKSRVDDICAAERFSATQKVSQWRSENSLKSRNKDENLANIFFLKWSLLIWCDLHISKHLVPFLSKYLGTCLNKLLTSIRMKLRMRKCRLADLWLQRTAWKGLSTIVSCVHCSHCFLLIGAKPEHHLKSPVSLGHALLDPIYSITAIQGNPSLFSVRPRQNSWRPKYATLLRSDPPLHGPVINRSVSHDPILAPPFSNRERAIKNVQNIHGAESVVEANRMLSSPSVLLQGPSI